MRRAVRQPSAAVILFFLAFLSGGMLKARATTFDTVIDGRTGVRISIPVDIVGHDSTQQERGSSWTSRADNLSIDTLNFGNTRTLPELFSKMKGKAGRKITKEESRDDSFSLTGSDDHGSTKIYIRMRALNGEVRGVSIAFDSSAAARLDPVAAEMMSSFEPFPAPGTTAANAGSLPAPATTAGSANPPVEIVPPLLHGGDINSVVVSFGQDRFVASSADDGIIKLWDMATGRLIRDVARIDPEDKYWRVQKLSSDGRRLLGVDGGDTVVWDTVTGQRILTVEGALEEHTFMNPTGTYLVAGFDDKPMRAFDARSGKELSIAKGATIIRLSPDGKHAVAAGADGAVYETDATVGSRDRTLTSMNGPLAAMQFSPSAKSLAIQSAAGDFALWSFEQDKSLLQLKGEKNDDFVFSADGAALAYKKSDGNVEVFDTATGVKRTAFKAPQADASFIGFLKGGSQVGFTEGKDGAVKIVNLQDGAVIDAHSNLPDSEALGSRYYVGFDDGGAVLHLKDIENGQVIRDFGGETSVAASAFAPFGANVATASKGQPKLFNPQTGQITAKCEAQDGDIHAVRISNNGRLLAYGNDTAIDLCDLSTGRKVQGIAVDEAVRSLAFSPDDRQLLVGGINGSVKLWDVQNGTPVKTFFTSKAERAANLVAFSPDGKKLFNGTDDNRIHVWDAASGKELQNLRMLIGPVTAMAVSPDGRRVAGGSYSELTIKQWDVDSGKELRKLETGLEGRFTTANDVKYSPSGDGTIMATAKNQIDIWDAGSGKKKAEIKYQDQEFAAISYTPEQHRILSVDASGVVRHWDRNTAALLLMVVSFGEGEWVQVTPEGFFDASKDGASHLTAVRGLDVYPIDRFEQLLHRPDLVREKLAGDPRGLVRAAAASLDLGKVIASGEAPDMRQATSDVTAPSTPPASSAAPVQ
jgi:WD40 repeat protein